VAALVGSLAILGFAAPRNVPLSPGQSFRFDPAYDLAIGNPNTEGLDWYDVAGQLIDAAPKWDDTPGSLVFWYPTDVNVLNSLQSTFLWTASTVQGGSPGVPNLTDAQKALLVGRTPRHLMLLGLDPADLAAGRSTLEALGLRPLASVQRTLSAGNTTIYSELLTFQAAACDQEWRTWTNWSALAPCA
jgi:hypothetical protein